MFFFKKNFFFQENGLPTPSGNVSQEQAKGFVIWEICTGKNNKQVKVVKRFY